MDEKSFMYVFLYNIIQISNDAVKCSVSCFTQCQKYMQCPQSKKHENETNCQIVRKWLNEKLRWRKKSNGDILVEGTPKHDCGRAFEWTPRAVAQLNNNFVSISSSRLTQYRNLRGHDECVRVCAILLIILSKSNTYQHKHTLTQNFVRICIFIKTHSLKRKRLSVKATIFLELPPPQFELSPIGCPLSIVNFEWRQTLSFLAV